MKVGNGNTGDFKVLRAVLSAPLLPTACTLPSLILRLNLPVGQRKLHSGETVFMKVDRIDRVVLTVNSIEVSCEFYTRVLGILKLH